MIRHLLHVQFSKSSFQFCFRGTTLDFLPPAIVEHPLKDRIPTATVARRFHPAVLPGLSANLFWNGVFHVVCGTWLTDHATLDFWDCDDRLVNSFQESSKLASIHFAGRTTKALTQFSCSSCTLTHSKRVCVKNTASVSLCNLPEVEARADSIFALFATEYTVRAQQ